MTNKEAIRKLQKQKLEYLEEWVDFSGVAEAYDMAIKALSAEAIQLKQTDTLIIATALQYLREDKERHELDRATAKKLKKQILKLGASMCADAAQINGSLINKQNTINAIENTDVKLTKKDWDELMGAINALPSAEAVQGEWVLDGGTPICSVCHEEPCWSSEGYDFTDFCPNCGADMRGGEDE